MRFCDFFAGIGGFRIGLEQSGHKGVWACENDDYCRQIYTQHFEEPQGVDINDVKPGDIPEAELWTGGFPCQDLSVAGKGEGIKGKQSGVYWAWHKLIKKCKPEWLLIENVPGLLSGHDGADFQALLSSLTGTEIPMPRSGKWPDAGLIRKRGMEIAWRILDAQYFGLAQRRRRVFIIRRLGKGGPAEVLFECESRKRDPQPKRETGREIAASIEGCANNYGGLKAPIAGASAFRNRGTHIRAEASTYVVGALKRRHDGSAGRGGGNPIVAHAVTRRTHKGGDPTTDQYVVAHALTQGIRKGDDPTKDQLVVGPADQAYDIAPTLYGSGAGTERTASAGNEAQFCVVSFEENQRGELRLRDVAPTLNAKRGGKPGQSYAAVLDRADVIGAPARGRLRAEDEMVRGGGEDLRSATPTHTNGVRKGAGIQGRVHVAKTLTAPEYKRRFKDGKRQDGSRKDGIVYATMSTPIESEAQATPDSPRYKALGNAVAVPVIKWIGDRLARYG